MSTPAPDPAAETLSRQQEEAVLAAVRAGKNVQILGRAGAGKTTRLILAVETMPRGEKVCVLAFNRAIVRELRQRLHPLRRTVEVSTIDKMKWEAYRAAHPGQRHLKADAQRTLLEAASREAGRCEPDLPRIVRTEVLRLRAGAPVGDVLWPEVAEIYARHKAERGPHGSFDSSDVASWVAEDPGRLARYLRRRFTRLVVDEAHDLSTVENRAVTLFSEHSQVVMAGDDEQSINDFRGADRAAFLAFGEREGTVVVELTVTWRSRANLVEQYLNPWRKRWFPDHAPLVAGHSPIATPPFSVEVAPDEGAVLATVAGEIAAVKGRRPKGVRRGRGFASAVQPFCRVMKNPTIAVICARNSDVDAVTEQIKNCGVATFKLEPSGEAPCLLPGAHVRLVATDPYDETSLLGRHLDHSWAPRLLASDLSRVEGRKLGRGERRMVERVLKVMAEHRGDRAGLLPAVRIALLPCLSSTSPAQTPLEQWGRDVLKLVTAIHPEEHSSRVGTRALLDLVDSCFGPPSKAVTGIIEACGDGDRLEVARRLREHDQSGKKEYKGAGPLVVIGTVNQMKGLTFDLVWLVVPAENRFPFKSTLTHTWSEISKWLVAVTRAAHMLRVVIAEGVECPYLQ